MGIIEGEGACRHREETEELDLCRDHLHQMEIEDHPCKDRRLLMDKEVVMTKEVVDKVEDIQMVVQQEEAEDLPWIEAETLIPDVSIVSLQLGLS